MLGRVLGRLHHDAAHRPGDGAELAADALLEAIGVAMQDVAAARAWRDGLVPVRVPEGDGRLGADAGGSCHASGRSKGAWFVSAMPAIKYRKKAGSSGSTNHQVCWALTISTSLTEPARMKTGTSERPSAIS